MTTDEAVTRILEDTLEYLSDPDHWYQGDASNPEDITQKCLIGALTWADAQRARGERVGYRLSRYYQAQERCRSSIAAVTGEACYQIARWNDDPQTTHEDVVLVLKRAINDA